MSGSISQMTGNMEPLMFSFMISLTIWVNIEAHQTTSEHNKAEAICVFLDTWISNHMSSTIWDELTYPFPNFNGCRV